MNLQTTKHFFIIAENTFDVVTFKQIVGLRTAIVPRNNNEK